MNDLQRQLSENFASAFDRYGAHMGSSDAHSLEDLKLMFPLQMEVVLAQWAASLDIKTKHDLMKSSIDGIR